MAKTKTKTTPQEYARWVADIIEDNPEEYCQSSWYVVPAHLEHPKGVNVDSPALYDCSAACCIAGWMAACAVSEGEVSKRVVKAVRADDVARNMMGISSDQADTLFSDNPGRRWPEPYATEWRRTEEQYDAKKLQAGIAARLLRDWADGKVEL